MFMSMNIAKITREFFVENFPGMENFLYGAMKMASDKKRMLEKGAKFLSPYSTLEKQIEEVMADEIFKDVIISQLLQRSEEFKEAMKQIRNFIIASLKKMGRHQEIASFLKKVQLFESQYQFNGSHKANYLTNEEIVRVLKNIGEIEKIIPDGEKLEELKNSLKKVLGKAYALTEDWCNQILERKEDLALSLMLWGNYRENGDYRNQGVRHLLWYNATDFGRVCAQELPPVKELIDESCCLMAVLLNEFEKTRGDLTESPLVSQNEENERNFVLEKTVQENASFRVIFEHGLIPKINKPYFKIITAF